MVGGIHYRAPGLWVKATTTLDVLSGGRAWFGIGAAWNVLESKGLGFDFPPLKDRFEWLEDTLRFAHEMWSEGSGTHGEFTGTHLVATHAINSPQSISRPRIPILVGGGGERKTPAAGGPIRRRLQHLRSRARVRPSQVRRPAGALRRLGRPYDEIERTVLTSVNLDEEETDAVVERFGGLAEAGAQHIIFSVRGRRRHVATRAHRLRGDGAAALTAPSPQAPSPGDPS